MTFRGTVVALRSISIRGDAAAGMLVAVSAAFLDKEGSDAVVHGTVDHSISIRALPKDIQTQLTELHSALAAHIENIHFDRPEKEAEKEPLRDIISSLQPEADPSDRVGKPG